MIVAKKIEVENVDGSVILTIHSDTIPSFQQIVVELSENQAERLVQPLAQSAHDAREYLAALAVINRNK